MGQSDLLRVREHDPEYRRQAGAEAEFWSRVHPLGLDALEDTYASGPSERWINERFTGDRNTHWYDVIPQYGPFRRGVVLGTSALGMEARILKSNPTVHLSFIDISPGALARRTERLGEAFPGRIEKRCADLNFVELPAETHDLVVSAGTVHHVTNLEHLAEEINRTLTPDGFFFFQDYIGEPRFESSPAKKRCFEILHDRARRCDGAPHADVVWFDASDLSPFCGVRSDETLGVLRAHLTEVRVRTAGTLLVPLMRSRPAEGIERSPATAWSRRLLLRMRDWRRDRARRSSLTRFLDELALVGDAAADAGLLVPGTAFGIYRKRTA